VPTLYFGLFASQKLVFRKIQSEKFGQSFQAIISPNSAKMTNIVSWSGEKVFKMFFLPFSRLLRQRDEWVQAEQE
jgi:hypothetical protein